MDYVSLFSRGSVGKDFFVTAYNLIRRKHNAQRKDFRAEESRC